MSVARAIELCQCAPTDRLALTTVFVFSSLYDHVLDVDHYHSVLELGSAVCDGKYLAWEKMAIN